MDFRRAIAELIAARTGMDAGTLVDSVEVPPQPELGDYAFPCFPLARTLRKSPPVIAAELAATLAEGAPFLDRVQAVGGYLNFFLDRGVFVATVVADALQAGSRLGATDEGAGKTVIVEFSSPNIAKPFHIGHAFTTILGQSLYKLYAHLGYHVVRMNHLGDYGTQFGKLIVAYEKWGDEPALLAAPIKELLRIYVKFHDEAKKEPALDVEARARFLRLEEGGAAEMALWKRFRDLSLLEFARVYDRMGISFDNYNGESFYSDRIPAVVDMLRKKGLLVESEGAQVVHLEEEGLPPCIVLKSDGATIYASRDIASVLYRKETYDFFKNIYVVGTPQALHFRQVFAVLKKAGFDFADDCVHVGFGLVKFADRKLSTREGEVIFLDELLAESVAKTREIIDRNADLRGTDMGEEERAEIAEKVGIGAVQYAFVKNGRDRDIVFSWEEMLDFEGESAPYAMYTYARGRSVLRKAAVEGSAGGSAASAADLARMTGDDEVSVAKLLYGFGDAVHKAVESNEPFMMTRQVAGIARAFNKFYNNESILSAPDEGLRRARIALTEAVCVALRTGLDLVGISAVERM
jgi:arginyl-tRNA synthetase